MKKIIKRLFRHLTTTRRTARQAFPEATLKAIQAKIAEGELTHRAQVRMVVEASLHLQAVLEGVTSRQRAQELFSHYRMWDTEENIGVLVYVNIADHKVDIITDRAVGRAIRSTEWLAVCQTMTREFANGTFHDSTLAALGQLNGLLTTHFPDRDGRRNELSDRPVML